MVPFPLETLQRTRLYLSKDSDSILISTDLRPLCDGEILVVFASELLMRDREGASVASNEQARHPRYLNVRPFTKTTSTTLIKTSTGMW